MKEQLELFDEYVHQFDLITTDGIFGKYYHSYRVMYYSKVIAKSLNMNENDILIVSTCGLLHDLGRFIQWRDYKTFNDSDSIDHGDLSYEILKKDDYIKKYTNEVDIVLNAVKYHNKYTIDPNLDDRTKLFCEIVRDADKIDIILEQNTDIEKVKEIFNSNSYNSLMNHELVKNDDAKNLCDEWLRTISFIYEINTPVTYKIVKKEILNKLDKLYEKLNDERIIKLKENINNYIDERCIKC